MEIHRLQDFPIAFSSALCLQPPYLDILGRLVKNDKAFGLPPGIVDQLGHTLRRRLSALQLDDVQTRIHATTDTTAADNVDTLRIHPRVNKPRSHHSSRLLAGTRSGSLHSLLEVLVREPVRRAHHVVEHAQRAQEQGSGADRAGEIC